MYHHDEYHGLLPRDVLSVKHDEGYHGGLHDGLERCEQSLHGGLELSDELVQHEYHGEYRGEVLHGEYHDEYRGVVLHSEYHGEVTHGEYHGPKHDAVEQYG